MFQTVGIGFLPTFLETKTKFRTYPLPHADPPGSCRHSGHPHPGYAPEQQTTPAVERSANDSGFRLRGRFFETQAHQVKSTCNFRSYLIIQVKKKTSVMICQKLQVGRKHGPKRAVRKMVFLCFLQYPALTNRTSVSRSCPKNVRILACHNDDIINKNEAKPGGPGRWQFWLILRKGNCQAAQNGVLLLRKLDAFRHRNDPATSFIRRLASQEIQEIQEAPLALQALALETLPLLIETVSFRQSNSG